MRFQPLRSDYWPRRVRRPLVRLAVAAVLTPPMAALALALGVFLIETLAPHPRPWPFQPPAPFFFMLTTEFYFFALVGVAPVFLLLWSLRLRSHSAFILGGVIGGALGAAALSLRFDEMDAIQFMIAIALGVALALTLRSLAGVRER